MLDAVPCALQILCGGSAFCQGCILLEILDSCRVLDALISISTMDNIGIHVLVYPPFQSSIALISISAMANIEFHFLVYPPLHCSRCSYFNIDHGQYWNSFPLISADTMQSVVNVETPLPMRPCHTGTRAILTFIACLKLARIWYNDEYFQILWSLL